MSRPRKLALGLAAILGLAACATLIVVGIGQGLAQASLLAGVLAAVAGVVAAVAAIWPLLARPSTALAPPRPELPEGVVDRPAEAEQVVELLQRPAGTTGTTTVLQGPGGFGKTVLAQMVCADRRVQKFFSGHVYRVTVGRDVRGRAALAAKVNDVIKIVAGQDATFTDPELAGNELGALLSTGPRRLLVLDDVWEPEQLAPFARGGQRCARLVTTRVPDLVADRGAIVRVDAMSSEQARLLLTAGLPPLPSPVTESLLVVTGRWPLLLRLVNKILANAARTGADVAAAATELLQRLREGGPAVVDDLLGGTSPSREAEQPAERARAVRSTIGASTSLLGPQDARRFTELCVFAGNEVIPFGLVSSLWHATAGLTELQARQVWARLDDLALVTSVRDGQGGGALHDVIRDFLRGEMGQQSVLSLSNVLLDAIAVSLPSADPLDPAVSSSAITAWWELSRDDRYVWDHLIEHLLDAGRPGDADVVAGDLRWVGARLERFGPAAPAADLSLAGTPQASRREAALARTAHLLAPTEPARAVVDVLYSRVADDPDWAPQVAVLRDLRPKPRLINRWPPPDLASTALRRVLAGTGWVHSVAAAPDSSWLATGSGGVVRIWDATSWKELAALGGHRGQVQTIAVAPDGGWLATGNNNDGKARIWDTATWTQRVTLEVHPQAGVWALAVAPDGSWLATETGRDGKVQIWDTATWTQRVILDAHPRTGVWVLEVAPDGSWLATGGWDTVRIWDTASWRERATLGGPTGRVRAIAIAPDSSWLATGSTDRVVRIWDTVTWALRATLEGHAGWIYAVAVSPAGDWLATGAEDDQNVRIWDTATWKQRATMEGARVAEEGWGGVEAMVIAPDSSWLATVGRGDGVVRIWGSATERERTTLAGRTDWVNAVAVAPDGSWLAAGGSRDGMVRIWDAATGTARAVLGGHVRGVKALAVAPDGNWLAVGGNDGDVRIWDTATWKERATFTGRVAWVSALAIAPDGSWLAVGSGSDFTLRIWDGVTGRERAKLSTSDVQAVAVAPDGTWLAVGSSGNGNVRIWDTAAWEMRASLTADIGAVNALAVAPDGSWLAVGGRQGKVRIWDAATWTERVTFTGHTDWVNAASVAPDGRWLATGGNDRTVRIWDTAAWQAQALMRVENAISVCAWLDNQALAAGGPAGLYLFDLMVGS